MDLVIPDEKAVHRNKKGREDPGLSIFISMR